MLMFPSSLIAPFCTDSESLGRIDYASLTEQSLMELLASRLTDVKHFQDDDGTFTDISKWTGLSFREERLTHIDWCNIEFFYPLDDENPSISPGGCIDLRFVPPHVMSITLKNMRFGGTVRTACLPNELRGFLISENCFDGEFEISELPRTLQFIEIQKNRFCGTLDIPGLPDTCIRFDAGSNLFVGSIDMTSLPVNLIYFSAQSNNLTGTVDLRFMPRTLNKVLLEKNHIEQEKLIVTHPLHITFDKEKIHSIFDTDGNDILRKFRIGY